MVRAYGQKPLSRPAIENVKLNLPQINQRQSAHARIASYVKIVPFVVFVIGIWGCSGAAPVVDQQTNETASNLMVIHRAYVNFFSEHQNPPANKDELKPYLERELLTTAFVSSRDGKPYKIYWGTPIDLSKRSNSLVIAHEQDGVNGTRYVMTSFGVSQLTDKQYQESGLPRR